MTVREDNENSTAKSHSKSISDSNKNAVSTLSTAKTHKGGYAIAESTSETLGVV